MKCISTRRTPFLTLIARLFCLLAFVCQVLPPSLVAAELVCKDCHQDVIDAGMGRRVVHKPFFKKQCGACHVAGQKVTPMVPKKNAIDETMPKKIRWFREAYSVSARHWVLLAADAVDDTLIYKTWEGSIRAPLQKITLPSLGELPAKENDGRSPVISNVRVQDVRRGISTTATIAWETDEFADAQVDYGFGAMNSSNSTHQLAQEHQIILTGLDTDKKYSFQVTSSDLFGNRSQSAVLSFSTDKTFMLPEPRRDSTRLSGSEAEVDYQLFRQAGNYLIVFEAERPVSLAIGVPNDDPGTTPRRGPELDDPDMAHPVLKSEMETSMLVCDSCHGGYLKGSVSHPVNILPKPGMVIPKEYQLLADGRVSCMSCHVYHGGNNEYRLLKADKKALCTGCHSDY